jgi:hypothetical protein
MDHITFGMPVLGSPSSRNLNELFQDRPSTSMTSYRKFRTVVEVTIYLSLMLVITVVRSENRVA